MFGYKLYPERLIKNMSEAINIRDCQIDELQKLCLQLFAKLDQNPMSTINSFNEMNKIIKKCYQPYLVEHHWY
jgi:hypothetical protein